MSSYSQEVNKLQNIAQFIADKLETMILTGELAPRERLVQTEVAERFGVSRLPVRDAFAILLKKDLVVNLPRKGVMVRSISEEEINSLFEMRKLLETFAVRKSIPHLQEEELQQAEAIVRQQAELDESKLIELLDIDESFHKLLWSRCNNEALEEHLSLIWRRIKMIRAHARDVKGWKERSVKSHKQVIKAMRQKEYDKASQQIENGIDRSQSELLESLKRAQPAEPGAN